MNCRVRAHTGFTHTGFTLVEMMVALVLLGLLAVIMSTGLFLAVRSWEAVELRQNTQDEVFTVQHALRRTLGNIRQETILDSNGARQVAVYGNERELIFVAPLKQLDDGEQLYWIRLAVEQQSVTDKEQLVIAYKQFIPTNELSPDTDSALNSANLSWGALSLLLQEEASSVVLYRGDLSHFRLDYLQAKPGAPPEWNAEWIEQSRLPLLMRIVFQQENAVWPALLIRPRVGAYEFKSIL